MNNFDEILLQYKNYLYYLMKLYNINTSDDDMYQRALIGLWKASTTFDETRGVTFVNYATKIITSELFLEMRYRRKHTRLNVVPLDEPIKDTEDLTYRDLIPSLENTEEEIIYYDLQDILDDSDREILKYVSEGYTQQEIAVIFSSSQSTMYRRIKRIRDKVDRYLKRSN